MNSYQSCSWSSIPKNKQGGFSKKLDKVKKYQIIVRHDLKTCIYVNFTINPQYSRRIILLYMRYVSANLNFLILKRKARIYKINDLNEQLVGLDCSQTKKGRMNFDSFLVGLDQLMSCHHNVYFRVFFFSSNKHDTFFQ